MWTLNIINKSHQLVSQRISKSVSQSFSHIKEQITQKLKERERKNENETKKMWIKIPCNRFISYTQTHTCSQASSYDARSLLNLRHICNNTTTIAMTTTTTITQWQQQHRLNKIKSLWQYYWVSWCSDCCWLLLL